MTFFGVVFFFRLLRKTSRHDEIASLMFGNDKKTIKPTQYYRKIRVSQEFNAWHSG